MSIFPFSPEAEQLLYSRNSLNFFFELPFFFLEKGLFALIESSFQVKKW